MPAYVFGPYRLEPAERRLLRDGAPVDLTPKELDLLTVLVERAGRLATKDELLAALWPDTVVEENALSVQVSKLRAALGETARDWRYIETVPRAGYRFAPAVEVVGAESVGPGGTDTGSADVGSADVGSADVGSADVGSAGEAPRSAAPAPRRRPSPWPVVGLVAAMLAAIVLWVALRYEAPAPPPAADVSAVRSVAVLPLQPLAPDQTADADLAVLGLGLADALITQLGGAGPLAVRPTSAIAPYADVPAAPLEAGRALGVDAVLDGRLQRDGDRLRVTVQLLPTDGAAPLWTGAFLAQADDLLAVQDSVAQQVVDALALELDPAQRDRLARRTTDSPAAHRAYLVGRYHWSKRTDDGLTQAIAAYRDAVDADPLYALAWAALGEAYALQPWYAAEPPREAFPRAEAAAARALAIDPELAEAQAVLAQVAWQYERAPDAAEQHFRRALVLGPDVAQTRQWYGEFLTYTGRPDDGLAELRRALALDPLSLVIATDVGTAHFFARRYAEAEAAYRDVLAIEPDFGLARVFLAMTHEQQGRPADAVAELERALHLDDEGLGEGPLLWQAQLGRAYARAGRRADAEAMLAHLRAEAATRFVSPYGRALIHEALGNEDRALALLEEAVAVRDPYLVYLAQDPQLDALRDRPRFQALLET